MSTLQETLDAVTDLKLRRRIAALLRAAGDADVTIVINVHQPDTPVAENKILTFGVAPGSLLDTMSEDFSDAVSADLNEACGDSECPNCGGRQAESVN
jgi:hypothetical protein